MTLTKIATFIPNAQPPFVGLHWQANLGAPGPVRTLLFRSISTDQIPAIANWELINARPTSVNGSPIDGAEAFAPDVIQQLVIDTTTNQLYVSNGIAAASNWVLVAGAGSGDGPSNVPTITSFTPSSGAVGDSVVITGTNFDQGLVANTTVSFAGTEAPTFTIDSATEITTNVPSGASTGTISITNPAGTAVSSTDFTVNIAGSGLPISTHGWVFDNANSPLQDIKSSLEWTVGGTVVTTNPGNFNNTANFSGVSHLSFDTFGDTADVATPFTWVVLFRLNSLTEDFEFILDAGGTVPGQTAYTLFYDRAANTFTWRMFDTSGNQVALTQGFVPPENYNLAVLYYDGINLGMSIDNASFITNPFPNTPRSRERIRLGASTTTASFQASMDVDHIAFYNFVLTQSDVSNLWNSGSFSEII